MRYIVRAVLEREHFVAELQRRLPCLEVCLDIKRNAMDTFLRALDMAGDDACVHMEDDTVLTSGFQQKAEAVIAQHPDRVIQFFSMRNADLTVGSRWDRNFLMGQCFYLPAGASASVRRYHDRWPGKALHPTGLDTMVGDWLRERREDYWLHVPSLVDHRQVRSAIDPRRSTKRQSKTFAA
jgi:hypothetical protein